MNHSIASLLAQIPNEEAAGAALAGIGIGLILLGLFFVVLTVVAKWKINTKAGQPGWACLIPIYSFYVELRIAGMSPLWLLTLLACGVGYVIPWIICQIKTAQRFGQGTGFGIGLILLNQIFVLILAFGSAQYVGDKPAQA